MGSVKQQSASEHNQVFYDDLYRKRSIISHLLHMTVSFDQQSKAKLNREMILPFIAKSTPSRKTQLALLDFGSGWGTFLKKMPRDFKLYCFDLSEQAMKSVCRTLGKLGFNVESVSIENGKISNPVNFDFIVCSHVLEHVDNDREMLKTFYSALVPQGKLLLNVPINEVWEDPKHVREYTADSMQKLLEETGFELLDQAEEDKWTGYLLEKEYVSGHAGAFRKLILRLLRVILALLPLPLVRMSERMLFSDRQNQQLLVIARKVGS